MDVRVLTLVVAGVVVSTAAPALAQPVAVSVATDGTAANNNSLLPSISASGRFVTFMSFADNLVPGDTNGVEDVFLRDRDTDADGVFDEPGAVATIRVSQRGGIQANGPSHDSVITPDGRYVVFTSFASNLFTAGLPPLGVSVVLRWDRLTGEIVLVSQTTAGQPLLGARSVQPDVSDDGNHVVFVYGGSLASEADQGYRGIVFRRNVAAGTLTEVSQPPVDGPTIREFNEWPTISGDGRTIAYGVAGRSGIFTVHGVVRLVDAATNAVLRAFSGVQPRLSADGAFLAFIEPIGSVGGPMVRLHLPSGERLSTAFQGLGSANASLSPDGRYYSVSGMLADYHYGSFLFVSAQDRYAFDGGTAAAFVPQTAPGQILRVVVSSLSTLFDGDADGLNDHWEGVFGLSTAAADGAIGANGPAGDPDGDGVSNADELAAGSHPTGSHARFLAEGAASAFFTTRFSIANPAATQANVSLRLDLDRGGHVVRTLWVPGGRRVVFDSRTLGIGTASFSAVVESTLPLVVDRLMAWGDGTTPYGSHAEASAAAPGTSWFLAEGSTVLGFQLFYLLQNPQATPATATIRFLLPSGAPIERTYELPARSRTTIVVNDVPGLASTDVSAAITATQPIAVERAMYRSGAGQPFQLGHDAAAVAQPSATWLFGEGASGPFFDTYLLLANPSPQPAVVEVAYLRDAGGPVTVSYDVAANSRFSVFVDGIPGVDQAAFGMRVSSSIPIVAERAMYWSGGFFDYYEGHVAAGATGPAARWVLAESEQGGAYDAQSFVLLANTGTTPLTATLRSLPRPWGAAAQMDVSVPAAARVTVPLASMPGYAGGGIEVVQGPGSPALVVEGAIYWSVGAQPFAAGAAWLATRVP